MNLEEAEKIAAIIATTDDGCRDCVNNLCYQMTKQFHGFKWELVEGTLEPYIEDKVIVTKQKDDK